MSMHERIKVPTYDPDDSIDVANRKAEIALRIQGDAARQKEDEKIAKGQAEYIAAEQYLLDKSNEERFPAVREIREEARKTKRKKDIAAARGIKAALKESKPVEAVGHRPKREKARNDEIAKLKKRLSELEAGI